MVETGLTPPFLWMSGKSKNVEAAGRVFFLLPDLSRKIERDSARRVVPKIQHFEFPNCHLA